MPATAPGLISRTRPTDTPSRSLPVTGRAACPPARSGAELLAAVIAWFEESLTDPPPEIEATQEDLASAVRWLATTVDVASARGAELDRLLADALDAIDDGLAEDVVVRRLTVAATTMRGNVNEQVDWVDLLVRRYRLLRGG